MAALVIAKAVRRRGFTAVLCAFLVGACGLQGSPVEEVESRYNAEGVELILLEIHSGAVEVRRAEGDDVVLRTAGDQLPESSREGSSLQLKRTRSRHDAAVRISIPDGIAIDVEMQRGDILLEGLSGELKAHSVSGDIRVQDTSGEIQLRAERGDALVSGGGGNLRAVGDHGELRVAGFKGSVSMSTIMGTLVYEGEAGTASDVKLETDHGPVEVYLPVDASMDVVVRTTSGDAACMASELRQTYDGCEGLLGEGTGSLTVRTVSGRVDIRMIEVSREDPDG